MMNRRLRILTLLITPPCKHSVVLLAIAILSQTSGCVHRRPTSLLITNQITKPPPADLDDDVRLKVVTYNIWGLPSLLTGAHSSRFFEIAHRLQQLDPDIILLQEAWTATARRSAPSNGVWSVARASGQHGFFQQCGLLTLSKFPIMGGRFYPFSRGAFPDRFVNKGVLKVTVRLGPGRLLNIWNVHLQDGGSPAVRQSQVRELISLVQRADDNQMADVVGGDFNCTPGSALCQELENSLGPSVVQLANIEPFITWDALSPKPGAGETLDHIFVHRRISLQNLEAMTQVAFTAPTLKQRLSDHLGIESMLHLRAAEDLAGTFKPQLQGSLLPSLSSVEKPGNGE